MTHQGKPAQRTIRLPQLSPAAVKLRMFDRVIERPGDAMPMPSAEPQSKNVVAHRSGGNEITNRPAVIESASDVHRVVRPIDVAGENERRIAPCGATGK